MDKKIAKRFSGLLPVVVDCETGGVEDPEREALLEVAACVLGYNADGLLSRQDMLHYHVQPFAGAVISPHALEVTQIRPDHPFRFALSEEAMAQDLIKKLKPLLTQHHCRRAVLIGHNAAFDLSYLKASFKRVGLESSFPFHDFVLLDTATISALWYRETVLARAMTKAAIHFDAQEAHSALYDCEKTADLFCQVVNQVDSVRRF